MNVEIDVEAVKSFIWEFVGESDRAAVIVGAARLDYLLYRILEAHLVANPSSHDDLLDGDCPLSTFSAKINMCYRLGLIDSEFAKSLHLIRKIRNTFAHESSSCRLDDGAHRNRVVELTEPFAKSEYFRYLKRCINLKKSSVDTDKGSLNVDFFAALATLLIRLEAYCKIVGRTSNANALEQLPAHLREPLPPETKKLLEEIFSK